MPDMRLALIPGGGTSTKPAAGGAKTGDESDDDMFAELARRPRRPPRPWRRSRWLRPRPRQSPLLWLWPPSPLLRPPSPPHGLPLLRSSLVGRLSQAPPRRAAYDQAADVSRGGATYVVECAKSGRQRQRLHLRRRQRLHRLGLVQRRLRPGRLQLRSFLIRSRVGALGGGLGLLELLPHILPRHMINTIERSGQRTSVDKPDTTPRARRPVVRRCSGA